jgi:ABC-type molybdate transport system substrate-binding protein
VVQVYIAYDGAVPVSNANPDAALAFVRYLARDAARAVWSQGGLELAQ